MTDLRIRLRTRFNSFMLVNGTTYQIDKDGICKDINAEDTEKLLLNGEWTEDTEVPNASNRATRPRMASMLLTADGDAVEGQVSPADQVEAKQAEKEADAAKEAPKDAPKDAPAKEVVPEDGEHWPDPAPEMQIDYLRKMADAYGVAYTPRLGAVKLCERIKKAMYE